MSNNIFENIETEKRIDLNDRLWQRVEDKLDVNKYKSKSNKYKWISAAAIMLVLVGVAISTYPSSTQPSYQVTDFSIEQPAKVPTPNVEQQNYLKTLYNNLVNCTLKKDKFSC